MAMCVKTGAVVLLQEWGTFLVCDIHEVGSAWIIYAQHPPFKENPRQEVTHVCKVGHGWMKEISYDSPDRQSGFTVIVVDIRNIQVLRE